MDDPNRQRRQNEAPVHDPSNPRFPVQDPSQQHQQQRQHQQHQQNQQHQQHQQRRAMASSSTERFRPAPVNTSAARGMGGTGSYSGYYQDSGSTFSGTGIPQSAMSYQSSDYGQDARQTQSFGAYNPSMMYPVGQTSTQNPYDTTQQFQGRQPAQLQIMPAEVPQYFQSDTGSAASASALQPSAQASSATAAAGLYQQSQIPSYPNTLPSAGAGGAAGLGSAQPTTGDVSMTDPDYSAGNPMEERLADYNAQLATVFKDIRSGALERAKDTLLNSSSWLLTQVVDLGLNVDNRNQHADRIKMWNDFNHAWLALLQKQKDMMESGQPPQRAQSLVTKDGLERMGKELIRLCDGVERHGLVDYQYGVWEERIVAALTACLDIYDAGDEEAGPSGAPGD